MQNETIKKIIQFVKFGIVGFSNNIIFYIVNIAVLFALKRFEITWDFVVGNTAGFLISVLWSFYWNNKYVFKKKEGEKRSTAKTLLKTYISYGFSGIVLNNLLGWIWISVFGISKYIAPIISLFLTVPVNFTLNKLWAFRTN